MLSKFSVRKPFTVIVGIVLIIILGVVSFSKMTTDLLPSMEMPYALVMTTYQGASPEQVETTVTKPVEQSMATVSNIKEVTSYSSENMSVVMLEFEGDANMDTASLDMKEKLDMIKGYWPDEVGTSTIMKLNPNMMPVLVTALDSDQLDTTQLSKLVNDKVSPSIEAVEGVASVNKTGMLEENLHVIINEDKIKSLNKRVQKAMEGQFDEAQAKLDKTKSKLESGKKQLDSQSQKLNQTLAKAQTSLLDGKLTIAQKEVEITSAITNLQNQKMALQIAKGTLETQVDTLKDQLENETNAAAKEQLKLQISELEKQSSVLSGNIKTLDANIGKLEAALKEIQKGKKTLDTNLTKLQIQGNTANQKITSGAISIAQGESGISAGQQQLDSSKAAAKAAANLKDKITVDTVKQLLVAQNFEMPAGYITEDNVKYLVRVGDKVESQDELENLELMDLGIDGFAPITLSDVADVAVVNNKDDIYCRVNGNDGVLLTVQKQNNYSTADVSSRIADKLDTLTKENKGLHYNNIMDQGVYINMIVNSVLQNLGMGAVLAILILFFFLKDIKPTFVIACSIPISVVFAIVMMYFSGITLNVISLSGLALGVGMLVDNSIVVIENIYRLRKQGIPVKEAAITGAKQVAGAIAASTLTTISVFLPIVFTTGITRKLFVDMALTIGYSLIASLIIALTLVPMMSAGLLHRVTEKENKLVNRIRDIYVRLLNRVLDKKVIVIVLVFILFGASIFGATKMGTSLMPSMDSTQMSLSIEMEKGSSKKETAAMTDTVMKKVREISDVDSVGAMMQSSSSSSVSMSSLSGSSSSNDTTSSMYILLNENKKQSNKEIKNEIIKKTKKFDCKIEVQESQMDMSALGGSGVSVEIKGNDMEKLQEIANDVAEKVKSVPGTKNINSGVEDTTPDIHIRVNKAKATTYGLTVATVYQQLNSKLQDASKATTLEEGEEDWDVKVSDGAKENMKQSDLKNIKITGTKNGESKSVKLGKIATLSQSKSLSTITRNSQERMVTVTAEVKDNYNVGLVSNKVSSKLKACNVPTGYSYKMAGELESINDTTSQIGLMLLLAIVFMYLIMVAQFQSLKSPFIILFTIPLAFTGGLLGLFVAGKDLSIIAMIGFVMLAGIIVNNGIVLVDAINQLREGGMELKDAVLQASSMRLRPIFMTAITTILGLSTMAIGLGSGADMVQPMAIVTIGGLIYGTLLTLVFIPCIYMIFNRKKGN
ncbi:MAG: efflux RND transporter permease subunit [Anaerostipes sp.]|jgi:multidrug efflux pump subunit AcrB|nr:efflux RND transporter permease subunit [Anaerostipes sp.]MDD3745145.1 efflux RND transporter permease subunit [Anaerostipes sp.]